LQGGNYTNSLQVSDRIQIEKTLQKVVPDNLQHEAGRQADQQQMGQSGNTITVIMGSSTSRISLMNLG